MKLKKCLSSQLIIPEILLNSQLFIESIRFYATLYHSKFKFYMTEKDNKERGEGILNKDTCLQTFDFFQESGFNLCTNKQ